MISGWMRFAKDSKRALCFVGIQFIVSMVFPDETRYRLTLLFTGLTYNQLNNNLVSQAAEMSTHGFPNDVLSNLDPITLVIVIPIFDILVCIYIFPGASEY